MSTMMLASTVVVAALWSGANVTEEPVIDLRARAWTRVIAIRDESVRTLEWRERVVVHHPDGRQLPLFAFTARADDLRNLRFVGEQSTLLSDGSTETLPLVFSLVDGVTRGVNPDNGTAVVRPERPDLIIPWCVPSPFVGLGRFTNLNQLRSRADHLLGCSDLHIETETQQVVVLSGIGLLDDTRTFRNRVEVDAQTGDVVRHQTFDPKWGLNRVFVDWSMPSWTDFDGIRVPTRVEYRVFRVNPPPEIATALVKERKQAGLAAESMMYGNASFPEWERLRDSFLAGKYDQTTPASGWQSSDIEVLGVNKSGRLWFELPEHNALSIMSSALECEVDVLELEPSVLRTKEDSKIPLPKGR